MIAIVPWRQLTPQPQSIASVRFRLGGGSLVPCCDDWIWAVKMAPINLRATANRIDTADEIDTVYFGCLPAKRAREQILRRDWVRW